jgi:outer membrane protein assembly factor BamA
VPQKPKSEKSRDIKRVEEELSDLLTAQVEVRVKKRVKRHGRVEELGELAIQFGSMRSSYGVGISWISPVGPLRLAYARPITQFDGDKIQSLQFQIGTSF